MKIITKEKGKKDINLLNCQQCVEAVNFNLLNLSHKKRQADEIKCELMSVNDQLDFLLQKKQHLEYKLEKELHQESKIQEVLLELNKNPYVKVLNAWQWFENIQKIN